MRENQRVTSGTNEQQLQALVTEQVTHQFIVKYQIPSMLLQVLKKYQFRRYFITLISLQNVTFKLLVKFLECTPKTSTFQKTIKWCLLQLLKVSQKFGKVSSSLLKGNF